VHTRECRFPDIFVYLIDGSLTLVVGSQDLADMPDHALTLNPKLVVGSQDLADMPDHA